MHSLLMKIKTDYKQQTWKKVPTFSRRIVCDVAPLIPGLFVCEWWWLLVLLYYLITYDK